jgi:gluconolactonase
MNSTGLQTNLNCFLILSFAGYQSVQGQTYGTIDLPGSLADPGVQIQRAATSTPELNQWCEGPAVSENGDLFFSEQLAGNIWKVTPSGTMTKLVNIGSYSNGLGFHPVSRHLVVCEASQIAERDTATGAVLDVITSDTTNAWREGGSGGSNDLTFASNGDMFFTSWNQHIYFRSNDGTVNRDWNFPSSDGTCQWNGIEYIEEKGIMYVAQYGQNRVVAFDVDPSTHLIDTSTMKQFGPAINSPDGITVDSCYNVYVCSNSGQGPYSNSVVVLDSTGTVLGSITMAQANSSVAVNCVFGRSMFGGGPNPNTLYVTGVNGAFKIQLKVPGRIWPATTVTGCFDKRNCRHGAPTLFFREKGNVNGRNTVYSVTLEMFDLRGGKFPSLTTASGATVPLPGMSNMTAAVRTTAGETMRFTVIR